MNEQIETIFDCRRLGFVQTRSVSLEHRRGVSVVESARCFIFNSSSSSSTDARSGADGEAQLSTGGGASAKDEAISIGNGQGVASKDDGVSLGGYGSKNTLGSDLSGGQAVQNQDGVTLAGYGNKNVLGGVELGGNNTGTINIGDVKAVADITDKFASTVESLANKPAPLASGNSNLSDAGDVEETERDRATGSNNFIWWAVGILATLTIGLWLKSGKKTA